MKERVVVPVAAPHRRSIPADAFLGMILLHCHHHHPFVRILAYPPVCCLCQLCPRQVSLCVIVGHPGHHFFRHWWAACTPPMTTTLL